ncbi:hypothetical protein [Vulcanisaeta sp. JCM 14467]|uniref:hypothetical protein n=1 Tax=Vulcanisaeta sp. JCM 14467 TaxID=1295370 RepID=UPI002093C46D|nr:hypothetical protein [Vulcanisaeta sp. JCM 14467]
MMQLITALLAITYLITSSAIAYLLFSKFTWRGRAYWVLIGVGFMLLAVILQAIVQGIPTLIIVFTHVSEAPTNPGSIIGFVQGFVKSNIYWLAIYMGLIAGVFQETFRYLAVKDREFKASLYIGYGFAVIDIAFTVISALSSLFITMPMEFNVQQYVAAVSIVGLVLQPVISFTFHPGASLIIRRYQSVGRGFLGLLLMILAHTYIDSFTWYLDNAVALNLIGPGLVVPLSSVFFATVTAISALILATGLRVDGGLRSFT